MKLVTKYDRTAKGLPHKCYYSLPNLKQAICIFRGDSINQTGMVNLPDIAEKLNQHLGVSKAQESAMIFGARFGWDKPSANPANYDEQGIQVRNDEIVEWEEAAKNK